MHLINSYRVLIFMGISALTGSIAAQSIIAVVTHCQPDERVQYSCRIGKKTVSLCGGGTAGALTSLIYRYGAIGKIENEFVARPETNNRFFGSVGPANPGASISQVWFDKGEVRYLLTECTGGNCPKGGGLAVLRHDRILTNTPCADSESDDLSLFSNDLVRFTSRVESSRSATELLIIQEVHAYDVNKLFPTKDGPRW